MANTYIPIASTILSSSTASVTFSSIPATYIDLVVRYSFRTADIGSIGILFLTFNNNTSSIYSRTRLRADNSNPRLAESSRTSNGALIAILGAGTDATANTFSSNEIYIPNYTASTNKPFFTFDVTSTNSATQADQSVLAALFRSTDAITSIKLEGQSNFASGSTFHLYGIKNS